jgi:hypothetical protein
MSFVPRCFIFPVFSVLALVGCHRPPTQEEISARAAELVAEQLASKQAGTEEPAVELSEADKELLDRTNAALDEIIIPRVEFRDVTLREAVAFLQQRAIEIARELPNRAVVDMRDAEWKKAWSESSERSLAVAKLGFFVKITPQDVPLTITPQDVPLGESPAIYPLQAIEGVTMTIDQSDVSLREALQYLADLVGLKMKVGPGKVLFEPKD